MFDALRSGLREAGGIDKAVSSASVVQPVGMFRVRRKTTVSEVVRDVMNSILSSEPKIGLNGITVHRPKQIQILMTDLRKWEFTPDFPVDAALLGLSVDVSLKSIELIRDEESGHPAILITTASSVKPDVMIVCELEEVQATPDEHLKKRVSSLAVEHAVPKRYLPEVERVVGVAWGRGIAQKCMTQAFPIRGQSVSLDEAEAVARMIVKDLVKEQVVGAGLFFWMQLGYWLVKIIAALIQSNDARSVVVSRKGL
jgi:hypothetical protein